MDNLQRVVCLLVFFAPFRGFIADENCPVAAPGCKCEIFWQMPVINCESLGTITALPAFTAVETIYEQLRFSDGTTLLTLPYNSFKNLKVKELLFKKMKIRNIEPLAFVGLEDMVKEVRFGKNRLNSLEGFKTLINLRELYVDHNKLNRITASDFAPFASTLRALDLSYNKLTIVAGAFASLKSLRKLILNGCQLVTLSPTVFSEGMALQELLLDFNNFTTIPGETFSKLKNITVIELNDNQITILPSHSFADLPKLRMLHFHNNTIRKIEKEAFKNLPMLNQLHSLKNNRIEGNITKDMFVGLDSLRSLDLEKNLITSIENLHNSLPRLLFFTISNNPLHCDCAIAWMRSPLYYGLSSLRTICETPKDFKDNAMQIGSFPAEGCPMPTITPIPVTTITTTTTISPINTGAKSTICFISLPLAAMFAITF